MNTVYYIIEGLFLVLIILITLFHAQWFKENMKTGPFFHMVFAAVYVVPMIWVGWFWQHSWLLLLAIAMERFAIYNPMLNLIRGESFFYLSVNSKNPSAWDKLELKYDKAYPFIWAASLIGFIVLQFIL